MMWELAVEHHVIDSGCSLYIKMIYVGPKWGLRNRSSYHLTEVVYVSVVFERAFSLATIYRKCLGWLKHQGWFNLISFSSMTWPGLSGVWKNIMVMYIKMVDFSNVTGKMVLTEHSMARSYRWQEEATGRGHLDINIMLTASFSVCKTFGKNIKNTPLQSPGLAVFPFLDCMLLDEGQGGIKCWSWETHTVGACESPFR